MYGFINSTSTLVSNSKLNVQPALCKETLDYYHFSTFFFVNTNNTSEFVNFLKIFKRKPNILFEIYFFTDSNNHSCTIIIKLFKL